VCRQIIEVRVIILALVTPQGGSGGARTRASRSSSQSAYEPERRERQDGREDAREQRRADGRRPRTPQRPAEDPPRIAPRQALVRSTRVPTCVAVAVWRKRDRRLSEHGIRTRGIFKRAGASFDRVNARRVPLRLTPRRMPTLGRKPPSPTSRLPLRYPTIVRVHGLRRSADWARHSRPAGPLVENANRRAELPVTSRTVSLIRRHRGVHTAILIWARLSTRVNEPLPTGRRSWVTL
jgi:hypothetical protein